MPFLYLGFFVVAVVWLFWAVAWFVVWAVVMLAWPVALVLAAAAVLRALFRRGRRNRRWGPAFARSGTAAADTNSAFEEYRAETLRTLDEEHGKFRDYLDRLRKSRDKDEFNAYMAARRGRPVIIDGEASAV